MSIHFKLNSVEKPINYLLLAVSLLFIPVSFVYQSGNLSPDSINYFLQARDFWTYKINFPLGYPFLIKLLSCFTQGDFFLASKMVNLLSYILVLRYCYQKNFFYNQSIFIFSFYPFILFYGTSLAEPTFYLFLTIIVSKLHDISQNKFGKFIYLQLIILFFALVSIRFIGVFVGLTAVIFLFYLYFLKKISFQNFILLSVSVFCGILIYVLINKAYCGFYLGKRSHLMLAPQEITSFLKERTVSFLNDFSFFKIVFHKKLISFSSSLNWILGLLTLVIAVFVSFKSKNKTLSIFFGFGFFISLAAILYSYYTMKIDDNIRIKSFVFYFMIFLIVINLKNNLILSAKIALILLISFNIATYLIYSKPYFDSYKKLVKIKQSANSKHINIIYNNDEEQSHSKILLFKAILINKKIGWTESAAKMNNSVNINSKEIIGTD